MTGRNQAPDPKSRPGETKPGENETETGKSETIGVDEPALPRRGITFTPEPSIMRRRDLLPPIGTADVLFHAGFRDHNSGKRIGHFEFAHTVTEDSVYEYMGTYPGVKVGDRIREEQVRAGGKVIQCRWINDRPIPWVDFHILPNRCPPLSPIDPQEKG